MPTRHVQIDNEIKCSKLFAPSSFDMNPLIRMWHLVITSHIVVTNFLEYVKLAKLAMVQVIGSVEDKKCFSILAFMKFKFCNRLTTHLPFVVHMFAQRFYTIHNFPYKECIEQWSRAHNCYYYDG
jgi:hypothetical protein